MIAPALGRLTEARGVRRSAAAAALACALLAGACGGGGLPARLTASQAQDLHTHIDGARTAAAAGDLAATRAALDRLNAALRTLRDNGALDDDSAAELLKISAVTELKAMRELRSAAATAPPAADAAPAPPAPPAAGTTPPAAGPAKPNKGRGRAKGRKQGD